MTDDKGKTRAREDEIDPEIAAIMAGQPLPPGDLPEWLEFTQRIGHALGHDLATDAGFVAAALRFAPPPPPPQPDPRAKQLRTAIRMIESTQFLASAPDVRNAALGALRLDLWTCTQRPDPGAFKELLIYLREVRGLTPAKIVGLLNVHPAARKWLRATKKPPTNRVRDLIRR